MRITKFEAGAPHSSGEFCAKFECTAVNLTEQDVRMIRYDAVVTDSDGYALAHNSRNEIDTSIEPNGEATISAWTTLKRRYCGSEAGRLKLTMSCTLYSREYHKIGEVDLPSDELPLVRLVREVSSELIDGTLKANVLRDAVTADGYIGVTAVMLVQSRCEHYLPRIELKCDLLDADGGHSETDSRAISLNPHAASCIEGGFGYLKRAQLRGARIRAGLYVYRPVHTAICFASNVTAGERVAEDE